MPLVKCSECGKEISSSAGACPQCGANRKSMAPEALAFGCTGVLMLPLLLLAAFLIALLIYIFW